MSGNKATANIDNNRIKIEHIYKPLEITIDSKLKLETHINKLPKTLLLEFLIL